MAHGEPEGDPKEGETTNMSDSFYAKITPVTRPGGPGGPTDPDYGVEGPGGEPSHPIEGGGGRPSHPIALPPLPGVWPPAGKPSLPIYLPDPEPGQPEQPIYIEGTPEHPITLPPGTIWPPLPPGHFPGDKTAVLVWVVGVGARWFVYTPPSAEQLPVKPPEAQPKR